MFIYSMITSLELKVRLPLKQWSSWSNQWSVGGWTRHIDVVTLNYFQDMKEQGFIKIIHQLRTTNEANIFTKIQHQRYFTVVASTEEMTTCIWHKCPSLVILHHNRVLNGAQVASGMMYHIQIFKVLLWERVRSSLGHK